jgi:hypothetical protein
VRPFVEEIDAGQLQFLWWHKPDGKIPNEGDTEEREGISLDD